MGCTTSSNLMQSGDKVSSNEDANNSQQPKPTRKLSLLEEEENIAKERSNGDLLIINDGAEILTSSSLMSSSFSSLQSSTTTTLNRAIKHQEQNESLKRIDPNDLDHDTAYVDSNFQKNHANDQVKATELAKNNNTDNTDTKMAEEEVDIDLTDPEVGKAAVKIQAGFKNFMAKKKPSVTTSTNTISGDHESGKIKEPSTDGDHQTQQSKEDKSLEEALADIDLNDPEVKKAATKIQASFRGFKNRNIKETTMKST